MARMRAGWRAGSSGALSRPGLAAPRAPRASASRRRHVWPRLSGGCHLARETDRLIEAAGFVIEQRERFTFRIPPLDPPKTHVLGIARRVQVPGIRPVA
jgi:hypothetical protein